MAKLTNVKYPNEVVEIGGVQYRKVDREAKAGDIVKVLVDDYIDVEKGAFYSVITEDGATGFFDDDGDFREGDIEDYPEDFEVYEKVTEPAPPEYREVKREAKVGERIRIVAAVLSFGTYENGDEFTVTSIYGGVGVRIDRKWRTSPEKDAWVRHDEYVVLEPVNHGELAPQPERLKVGDYAKVIGSAHSNFFGGKGGDIVVLKEHANGYEGFRCERIDGYDYAGNPWALSKSLVRATESEVEAAKKAAERAKQIGEFADGGYAVVKSDADGYFSGGYRGSYVKVRPTSVPGPYALEVALPEQLGYNGYCNADALRKVTREEYEEATKPKPVFNVGDYAKVTVDNFEHRVGHIVQITGDEPSYSNFAVKRITYGGTGYIAAKNIEKISAEEVARIEEEAKWAAIGRKVNEYRRGDIIEATRRLGEQERIYGECTGEHDENALGVIDAGRNFRSVSANSAKLIVPVEQRFDRAKSPQAEGGVDLSK